MILRALIVAAALAAPALALAQAPPGDGAPSPDMRAARQAARQACAPDMATLCQGQSGRDAMMCLRQNHDKASQACQDALAKMRAARGMGHGPESAPPPTPAN
jgi:hypothetical protein